MHLDGYEPPFQATETIEKLNDKVDEFSRLVVALLSKEKRDFRQLS